MIALITSSRDNGLPFIFESMLRYLSMVTVNEKNEWIFTSKQLEWLAVDTQGHKMAAQGIQPQSGKGTNAFVWWMGNSMIEFFKK